MAPQHKVTTNNSEPYATIIGWGRRGYLVGVYRDNHPFRSPDYTKEFWFSKKRAEAWAKKKLAKLKETIEHELIEERHHL